MRSRFIEPSPVVGDVISAFVAEAAKQLELDFVLWYQGEPVWFVEKRKDDQEQSLIRRVQITLNWRPGKAVRLYFVPQIFSIPKTGDVIKTLEKIDTKNIKDLDLEKLSFKYKEFYDKVNDAWEIASKYDPNQLYQKIPRVGGVAKATN